MNAEKASRVVPLAQAAPAEDKAMRVCSASDRWNAGAAGSRLWREWNPDRNAFADTAESCGDVERSGRGRNRASRVNFRVTDRNGGGGCGPRGKSPRPVA